MYEYNRQGEALGFVHVLEAIWVQDWIHVFGLNQTIWNWLILSTLEVSVKTWTNLLFDTWTKKKITGPIVKQKKPNGFQNRHQVDLESTRRDAFFSSLRLRT